MDTDLIRDAFALQAERAPDTQHVMHALRVRIAKSDRRRRRTRIALLAAGAVAVVAAVPLAGSLHWWQQATGAVPAGAGGAVSTAETPLDFPLLYRPTWLPAGLHESSVQTRFGSTYVRRQYARDDGATLSLTVTVDEKVAGSGAPGIAEPLTAANATTGVLSDQPSTWLTWSAAPGVRIDLLAVNLGVDETTLRRIASSIVTDDGRRALPVRIGWLPDGVRPAAASVSLPGPTTITAGAMEVTLAGPTSRGVTAQSLSVGGRPVAVVAGSDPSTVTVQMSAGTNRVLTVTMDNGHSSWVGRVPLTAEDLARVAASTQVDG